MRTMSATTRPGAVAARQTVGYDDNNQRWNGRRLRESVGAVARKEGETISNSNSTLCSVAEDPREEGKHDKHRHWLTGETGGKTVWQQK